MDEPVFKVLNEVGMERKRQVKLWGYANDDINNRNDWAAYICHYVSAGAYNGKDDEYSEDGFRKNLVKAAAICIAAIETIDRGPLTPTAFEVRENELNEKRRHQEKLKAEEMIHKIFDLERVEKEEKEYIKLNPICPFPEYKMHIGCKECGLKNTCQAKG